MKNKTFNPFSHLAFGSIQKRDFPIKGLGSD